MRAAEQANVHDVIMGLSDPQGRRAYDAHVGERGVKLSGGQRQRVAIARVLLKNAPILVLDEATSALDSEVEAAIQEQLTQLMQGKTVVAIAHRLSTIAAMDRLVVLEKGRIVFKRAYCDWSHYRDAVREFHSAGIELIDIPQSRMSCSSSSVKWWRNVDILSRTVRSRSSPCARRWGWRRSARSG